MKIEIQERYPGKVEGSFSISRHVYEDLLGESLARGESVSIIVERILRDFFFSKLSERHRKKSLLSKSYQI